MELFGERSPIAGARSRPALLSAFMHHGMTRVIGRSVYVHPIVRFEDLSSFEELFGGYQEAVFAWAVGSYPASDVRFTGTS